MAAGQRGCPPSRARTGSCGAPSAYDPVSGDPTLDTDGAIFVADDGSPGKIDVWGVGGFSPDISQLVYTGEARLGNSIPWVNTYVTSATSNGSSKLVDNIRDADTGSAIWGP